MKLTIMLQDKSVQEFAVKRVFTISSEKTGKGYLYYELPGDAIGSGKTIELTELRSWEAEKVPHNCLDSLGTTFCKRCENCIELASENKIEYFCTVHGINIPVNQFGYCDRGKPGTPKKEKSMEPKNEDPQKAKGREDPAPEKTADPKRKHVDIYTDGACKGNPGPGGWGAIIVYGSNEKELGGGEASTTNNKMELTAVLSALSTLKEPCEVTLTTDSKYVVDSVTKGWVRNWKSKGWKKADGKPALNIELWEQMLVLLDKHDVTFVWVKGHDGHPYNERCDKIACEQAEKLK